MSPLGVYGDFTEVGAEPDGKEIIGFVRSTAIPALKAGLPELDSASVPWKPFFYPLCSPYQDVYDVRSGSITLDNRNNAGPADINAALTPLAAPLHFRVESMLLLAGDSGGVKLSGSADDQTPWWKDNIRMDILAERNRGYSIRIRDGTREDWNYTIAVPGLTTSEPIEIVFEQPEGKSLAVFNGEKKAVLHLNLTAISGLNLPNGLFPDGRFFFGTTMTPRSALAISGLKIGVPSDGIWSERAQRYPGLFELAARHNLTFGTEYNDNAFQDVRYCRTLRRNYNVVVLSGFSWKDQWIEPAKFDFDYLDDQVDFAVRQGWRVRGSVVWGDRPTGIPDWLRYGHYTRDEYKALLEELVKTTVGHFKGRVKEWIVANEAVSRSYYYSGIDFWHDVLGPEYIEWAFRWAHEADPEAILIFNDCNNESPRDFFTRKMVSTMYEMVKEMKAKGVPIDAVGMQMHLLMLQYNSPVVPKKEEVAATMRKFGSLGVEVYVTEFDVDLHDRPGSTEEQLSFQASLYRDMMEACLGSGVCANFTTWGVSDLNSWLMQDCRESWCIHEPGANPLLFDAEYNPKPAYFALWETLLDFPDGGMP
ncbi:MAG: endo-1,4-beta-xylanase [Anaerolineales bacterium]